MPSQTFRRSVYRGSGRTHMRSMIVVVAVAAIGYLVGALLHDSLPAPNESAAFARPVRASEAISGDPLSASVPLTTMRGPDESDAEWTETPRECALENGISTACMLMD